jgi:hypothetical protein
MNAFSAASKKPQICQCHPGITILEQLLALANEACACPGAGPSEIERTGPELHMTLGRQGGVVGKPDENDS